MSEPKTIDCASLTAPVKALLLAGVLVELGDAPWVGVWAFPLAWTEAHRAAWTGIQGHLIAERKRLDVVTEALAADLQSPEAQLAAARAEVTAAQEAREAQERLAQGVKAWREAQETYGTRCRHIPTVEGDIVIMVGMSLLEADAANARAAHLSAAALENDANAHARARLEATNAQRDAMKAKIIWPLRPRFEELVDAHPALWGDCQDMRNELARARADVEGKGFAP